MCSSFILHVSKNKTYREQLLRFRVHILYILLRHLNADNVHIQKPNEVPINKVTRKVDKLSSPGYRNVETEKKSMETFETPSPIFQVRSRLHITALQAYSEQNSVTQSRHSLFSNAESKSWRRPRELIQKRSCHPQPLLLSDPKALGGLTNCIYHRIQRCTYKWWCPITLGVSGGRISFTYSARLAGQTTGPTGIWKIKQFYCKHL